MNVRVGPVPRGKNINYECYKTRLPRKIFGPTKDCAEMHTNNFKKRLNFKFRESSSSSSSASR
jgi:hypothetical protein